MKGLYYSRMNREEGKDDWHKPVEGIVVERQAFIRYFPEMKIEGVSDERSGRSGHRVKIIFNSGSFTASHTDDSSTHKIGEFKWNWAGEGATEWWFDNEAVCLKVGDDYRSHTGLSASSTRIVAYKRRIEVDSFRGDCADGKQVLPKPGKIWAEFVNSGTDYRANWTGFAVGLVANDGRDDYGDRRRRPSGNEILDLTPIIGDDLDRIIEFVLSGKVDGKATVCKHNNNVQAHIITDDLKKIPLYLCKSCRMRGIRWEEFAGRNHQDTCPYFRRACKSVVEKSDRFPEWFNWSGDNLLSSTLRMENGEHIAHEVVYVRRKEGFVRRAVLLLNIRTHEAWMYRYNGYIPQTSAEFRAKYSEGRQVLGYMGTGSEGSDDPSDRFLSEAKIAEIIAQGLEEPLWQNQEAAIIPFLPRNDLEDLAVQKGEVGGLQITQLDQEGQERELEAMHNPTPFYTDVGGQYYLLCSNWQSLVLRQQGKELYRSERNKSRYYLLQVKKTGGE